MKVRSKIRLTAVSRIIGGMPFDLALSVQDAVRMSQNTYGAVLAGSDLGANALISVRPPIRERYS